MYAGIWGLIDDGDGFPSLQICSFCRAFGVTEVIGPRGGKERLRVGLLLLIYSLAVVSPGSKHSLDGKADIDLVDLFVDFSYKMPLFPVGFKRLKKAIVIIHSYKEP